MRCGCLSCLARDDAAFWAIVGGLDDVAVPTVSVAEASNEEELAAYRRRQRGLRGFKDEDDGA